jgi:hypothetical protein
MSELVVMPLAAEITALVQRAEDFVRAAKAPATLRAYRSDWAYFEAWCQTHQLSAEPPSAITKGCAKSHPRRGVRWRSRAVRSGRGRSQALESKVRFADHTPETGS